MKTQKIKHYKLLIADKFPEYHPKKGESTNFAGLINFAVDGWFTSRKKIHTIVPNYRAWTKIIDEVHNGCAVIDLVYQFGKYQVIFETLDKNNGCGMQELIFHDYENWGITQPIIPNIPTVIYNIETIAKNDGLSIDDFKAWFKGADLSEPMGIIHFTSFRY